MKSEMHKTDGKCRSHGDTEARSAPLSLGEGMGVRAHFSVPPCLRVMPTTHSLR